MKLFALAALLAVGALPARAASREIYPAPAQAKADLAAALKTAAATHQRILLDFGANWCPDCQMLDLYFHDAANLPILEKNFILVHVNLGREDANLDLVQQKKGIPALAVLSDRGELLFSQKNGEFEAMRGMKSSSVTQFLLQWKLR
jgi:thiol:disulfide interchange protein